MNEIKEYTTKLFEDIKHIENIFRKEGIKNKIIVKPRLNWFGSFSRRQENDVQMLTCFVIINMFVRLINKLQKYNKNKKRKNVMVKMLAKYDWIVLNQFVGFTKMVYIILTYSCLIKCE